MEMENHNGMHKGKSRDMEATHAFRVGFSELALRVLALLLTLVAAILLGLDKQTVIVPITISPDLPAFMAPVPAKYHYVSAFVYTVVVNASACVIAAMTLIAAIASKDGSRRLVIMVVDLMMVALLFSSIGATGAIGVIGLKGNSHLRWGKVCNVYAKFCNQVIASVILSLLGATAFLLLIFLSFLKLHKKA
ncbi:CASP-like protein 1E1 [Amaranthus tricolor]|uniref:CASP-like protein 1E1 n=1 Tax=Amaranthus tricolor TaxID=29722 RepID=UPI002584AA73|nr:CASP-like protein 1E1 [Amaranthus tricolor]